MRGSRHLSAVVALGVAGALSIAGTADAPEVTDPCGDAGRMVELARQPLADNPDAGRTAGFDVERAWFEVVPPDELPDDSDVVVRVTLDLCGDLPPVELHGSTWDVGWRLSERCFGRVEVSDIRSEETLEVERRAFFSGNCSRPIEHIVPGSWAEGYSLFQHELGAGAVTVDGDVITWTLDRASLDGAAADALAPGTVWARPTASTRDARQLTHAWQRHEDGSHTYFVSGPGGADDTRRDGGRDFVIE